jgi:hypothetical protein
MKVNSSQTYSQQSYSLNFGDNCLKFLHYRDSEFKICHRPGLGAQKVKNRCYM